MKIVYRKTIREQIVAAIEDAKVNGKEIEKFIVSKKEFDELYSIFGTTLNSAIESNLGDCVFSGIPIELE